MDFPFAKCLFLSVEMAMSMLLFELEDDLRLNSREDDEGFRGTVEGQVVLGSL